MTLTVTAADLDEFLGLNGAINTARATMIIRLIFDDAQSIVDPVPDNGAGVILSAAGRVYGNPQGVASESVGPFSVNHTSPGAYLTRREKARLRRLAGLLAGAFTVDPTPLDASPDASWPPVLWDDDVWEDA